MGVNFKSFYATRCGRVVRRLLVRRIQEMWPAIEGEDYVFGFGYTAPYLDRVLGKAKTARAFHFMNTNIDVGAHGCLTSWKDGQRVAIIQPRQLPLPAQCADRAILIHQLEFTQKLRDHLHELWHVLKPGGRAIVCVPNRRGAWIKADWSPFGLGTPFSLNQIRYYLHESGFDVCATRGALFLPPTQNPALLALAGGMEQVGSVLCPFLCGLHMIEVIKPDPPRTLMTRVKQKIGKGVLFPSPAS